MLLSVPQLFQKKAATFSSFFVSESVAASKRRNDGGTVAQSRLENKRRSPLTAYWYSLRRKG